MICDIINAHMRSFKNTSVCVDVWLSGQDAQFQSQCVWIALSENQPVKQMDHSIIWHFSPIQSEHLPEWKCFSEAWSAGGAEGDPPVLQDEPLISWENRAAVKCAKCQNFCAWLPVIEWVSNMEQMPRHDHMNYQCSPWQWATKKAQCQASPSRGRKAHMETCLYASLNQSDIFCLSFFFNGHYVFLQEEK